MSLEIFQGSELVEVIRGILPDIKILFFSGFSGNGLFGDERLHAAE